MSSHHRNEEMFRKTPVFLKTSGKSEEKSTSLRIMGSQNWWFEDPKEPCYAEQTPLFCNDSEGWDKMKGKHHDGFC